MARQGDTARARSVKAVFDEKFSATVHGGALLIEQTLRRLGLRKILKRYLPKRSGCYSSAQVCEQVIEGLLCGGKGFQAAEVVRKDPPLAAIFGHAQVAEEATVYRAMCDLAGLKQRLRSEAYRAAAAQMGALDVFGREQPQRKLQRIVPDKPEAMEEQRREQMLLALQILALHAAQTLHKPTLSLAGFYVVHGDGSDEEVRGCCFDAARNNHRGDLSLRLMTLALGPIYVGCQMLGGASDEATSLATLLSRSGWVVQEIAKKGKVLALLDAAFAEKQVICGLNDLKWSYIVCANQQRQVLERLVLEIQESEWVDQGPDAERKWQASGVAVMRHEPDDWPQPQTVVVRRWREQGEMEGIWHYSFLYTNLSAQQLPKDRLKRWGFGALIWMLYATKQGQENTYKTLLSDLGGHHPASGRLGASQALSYLWAMAANIHAVISTRVVDAKDRGIRLWRFIRDYVRIAGHVVMNSGKELVVRLAGADLPAEFKRRWMAAYATAGQL